MTFIIICILNRYYNYVLCKHNFKHHTKNCLSKITPYYFIVMSAVDHVLFYLCFLIIIKNFTLQKSNQLRLNSRQKKSDVVDQVLLQANELVRQSSIEPKKYIQNQLMFKKNKDKIGSAENSSESLLSPQKHIKQLLDTPELFSSSDIKLGDDKTFIKEENVDLNTKTNVIKKVDTTKTIEENLNSDISNNMIISKEEPVRLRKLSNRMKENPTEFTVTKTVEDILNDISSKIANQSEIINEENLIDELADLNEDLNSVCKLKSVKFNTF